MPIEKHEVIFILNKKGELWSRTYFFKIRDAVEHLEKGFERSVSVDIAEGDFIFVKGDVIINWDNNNKYCEVNKCQKNKS